MEVMDKFLLINTETLVSALTIGLLTIGNEQGMRLL